MTRHKKPEDRKEEILKAAAEEIELNGYYSLTMAAIADRADLSKGGLYRLFKNKKELTLALFKRLYEEYSRIDYDKIVALGLSLEESVLYFILDVHFERYENIINPLAWLQILPEVIHDKDFLDCKLASTTKIQQNFIVLVEKVLARENLQLSKTGYESVKRNFDFGNLVMQGLAIERVCGVTREQVEDILRWNIQQMFAFKSDPKTFITLKNKKK